MPVLARHPRLRWVAPLAAVAALVGGVAVSSAASGAGGAPPVTAQELLVRLQQAKPAAFSGEVRSTLDLGLPQLPIPGGHGGANLSSVISGSHDWRVWSDGGDRVRLALVDGAAESDIVHSGRDVWMWSSADHTATHLLLPAPPAGTTHPAPALPSDLAATFADPQQAAAYVLKALDPTTGVATTSTDTVAGRAAYGLVLTPRSTTTKVGSIHLSVDAETSLPLAVSVTARGATTPAINVAFTALSYAAPPASVFTFTPPPGTTVTTKTLGGEGKGWMGSKPTADAKPNAHADAPPTPPTVVGSGWDSVAVVTLPSGAKDALTSGPAAALIGMLPSVSGAWGSGHLLDGALISVLLTDDGRVAVGSVAPDALYAALR